MNKLPWMKFYVDDWSNDTSLRRCSLATRGFWIEVIAAMWRDKQCGQIQGTVAELAKIVAGSRKIVAKAIAKLASTKSADVVELEGVFTITNRRMRREWTRRENGRKRMGKLRANRRGDAGSDAEVTLSTCAAGDAPAPAMKTAECDAPVAQQVTRENPLSISLSQSNAPKTINEADLKSYAFEVANMTPGQWVDLMREAGALETARGIIETAVGNVIANGRTVQTWAGFAVTIMRAENVRPLPENTLTFARWKERKAAQAQALLDAEREREEMRVNIARPKTPEELAATRKFYAELRGQKAAAKGAA